jgi:phage host-nuclease inhibitor protein Gam
MKIKRIKTPTTSNLTVEQADELAAEISRLMINERVLLAKLDIELKEVTSRHSVAIERVRELIAARFPQLQAWAEANREKHFAKKKSIEFLHSTIGFKIGKPWVSLLSGWSAKKVLARMREHMTLRHYIRTKEEIDRQGIIAKRKLLDDATLESCGLRSGQTETFYLDPKATEPEAQQQPTQQKAA